jgi:hypothetical protein
MGGGKKKFLKKTQLGLRKGKKGQFEFTTLVNPTTGRDKKGAPINAPSMSTLVHWWWVLVHSSPM